jgi:hypothetical protein
MAIRSSVLPPYIARSAHSAARLVQPHPTDTASNRLVRWSICRQPTVRERASAAKRTRRSKVTIYLCGVTFARAQCNKLATARSSPCCSTQQPTYPTRIHTSCMTTRAQITAPRFSLAEAGSTFGAVRLEGWRQVLLAQPRGNRRQVRSRHCCVCHDRSSTEPKSAGNIEPRSPRRGSATA